MKTTKTRKKPLPTTRTLKPIRMKKSRNSRNAVDAADVVVASLLTMNSERKSTPTKKAKRKTIPTLIRIRITTRKIPKRNDHVAEDVAVEVASLALRPTKIRKSKMTTKVKSLKNQRTMMIQRVKKKRNDHVAAVAAENLAPAQRKAAKLSQMTSRPKTRTTTTMMRQTTMRKGMSVRVEIPPTTGTTCQPGNRRCPRLLKPTFAEPARDGVDRRGEVPVEAEIRRKKAKRVSDHLAGADVDDRPMAIRKNNSSKRFRTATRRNSRAVLTNSAPGMNLNGQV
jgi:hypothetical protein